MALASYNKQPPLDPMAKPYKKIPAIQHPPLTYYSYHHLPLHPPLYPYNVNHQPILMPPLPPRKPLIIFIPTHDLQLSQEKKFFSITSSIPVGPRIPKSCHPGYCRKGLVKKWVPKKLEKDAGKKLGFDDDNQAEVMIKKRWKNQSGEYHKILPLETGTTSLMIKNIPNKYTRKLMIHTLDHHCNTQNKKNKDFVSAYDFLYLPIDFNRRLSAGFAFVNFTDPKAALRFSEAFNGKGWGFFDSSKVAEISKARIQGKEALKSNFRKMDFSCGSDEDMPVLFEPARDGSGRVCSRMYTLGKFIH